MGLLVRAELDEDAGAVCFQDEVKHRGDLLRRRWWRLKHVGGDSDESREQLIQYLRKLVIGRGTESTEKRLSQVVKGCSMWGKDTPESTDHFQSSNTPGMDLSDIPTIQ